MLRSPVELTAAFFKISRPSDSGQLPLEPHEFRRGFSLPPRPRERPAMRGHVFLSFIETITRDAEFTGNLSGGPLARIQQQHSLSLKLGGKPSSLAHVAPPRGTIVPPFEVSVKPGPAQCFFAAQLTVELDMSAPPNKSCAVVNS